MGLKGFCPICGVHSLAIMGHSCSERFCRNRDRAMKSDRVEDRVPSVEERFKDGFALLGGAESEG